MAISSGSRRTPAQGPKGPMPTPAYYAPFWPSSAGSNGIVSYLERLTGLLRDRGVKPLIVTRRLGPDWVGDQAVVKLASPPGALSQRLFPRRKYSMPKAIGRAVRSAGAAHGVDVMQIEESFGWAAGLKPLLSVPMVVRLHGPCFLTGKGNGEAEEDERFRTRVAGELKGILAADAITAPSRDVLELTRQYYGIPLENATVVPSPVPEIPAERRWRLDDADRRAIAFVGRFDRIKGGDVMIDAFARVAASRPDVRLLFAGEDLGLADDDGRPWNLAEYIAARAPEAADRIEVLGRVAAGRVAEIRQRALVTVAPSRYDNYPNTVLEGAAFGVPMVASAVGGIPEIVQDGESALLVPSADPDALAAALGRLLDDPLLAARLGAAAGERLRREFNGDRIVALNMEVYNETIERAAAARR